MGLIGAPGELNTAVAARPANVLPVLSAIYLGVAILALFTRPENVGGGDGQTAYVAGICCLGAWMLLRRGRIPLARTHWMAGGICSVALLQGWVSFLSTESTVALLIIAAGGASLCVRRRHRAAGMSANAIFRRDYLERAVEGTQDGFWYWELQSEVFHFSEPWARLLGFEPGELTSHPDEWLNRVHPGYLACLRTELAGHLYGDAVQFRNEHRIRRKDGVYVWVMARGTAVRNEAGEPIALAGSHIDITPLIKAEKRLLTDAFNDMLTGLSNRSFLMGHLDIAVRNKHARGNVSPLFAVLFLDLDRFKFINDTMGHEVGDRLLQAVAARLKNCARPDDVVARFGGDEFVILLRNLRDPEEAMHVAERIQKALATPFQLGERTVQSGGSIGVALSRESFDDSNEILRFGDIAMYRAKSLRNGQAQLFHPAMLDKSAAPEALQSDLASALERKQMVLHYQPLIHLASGKIVGAEALIRWQRSPGELLYPREFVPLAEKSGLIEEIGEWALRTACAQNSAWQREGDSPIRIAVNLSAGQLQQQDFPRMVKGILEDTKLGPEWLEVELTEAVLMQSMDAAPALKTLNECGIRAAIDDFGSGNASLNYLRQFQFHTMKLHRSFVSGVTTNTKAAAVARGLITLAHSLDLSVVAEGVENDDQFRFLSAERCDLAQGDFTGRPVPAGKMAALLRQPTGQ